MEGRYRVGGFSGLYVEVVCVCSLRACVLAIWDNKRESWKGWLSGLYVPH